MNVLHLPCGESFVSLGVPSGMEGRVKVLETRPVPPLPDPDGAVRSALVAPLGTPPLAELARSRASACVVVSDTSRPVPNQVLLPPVLETLEAVGLPRGAITLLIATGMHPPVPEGNLADLVGPEVARTYRVVNHSCRDPAGLVRVDTLGDTPVEINRTYVEADLKILTGLIEPHGFAGFSGGGKSVVPGLASFDTMGFMHSFALVEHPGVATARLEGNPFRDHMDRVVRATGSDFIVNVTTDRAKRITGVWAGDVIEAFRAGCRQAEAHAVTRVDRPAELVVTTGGGAPMDTTLYQATKGLFGALELVRPGGTILWVAGCAEGAGSTAFDQMIRSARGNPTAFRARHADPTRFEVDQWAAQAYFQVIEKAGRVLFHSPHLGRDEVAAWGLMAVDDPDTAFRRLLDTHKNAFVVPEGPHVAAVPADQPVHNPQPITHNP